MRNSITYQLMIPLIALLCGTAVINAIINFYDILQETHHLQDDMIRQVAHYLDPHVDYQTRDDDDVDDDTQLLIQTSATPVDKQFIVLKEKTKDGFHSLSIKRKKFRYYLEHKKAGYVIVMQRNDYRTELAMDVAWDNAIPFLVLIPLLAVAIVATIHYKMRTIKNVSQELSKRQDLDLTPIHHDHLPDEVQGFVLAINQLFERTTALIQQQQRFIADAAHEMRSPMTALSLQVERLAGQKLPEPYAEQVDLIQSSIQRNRHLIEQLLSLARAQAKGGNGHRTEIHVQSVFRQVIEALLPLSQAKAQDLGVVSEQDVVFHANESEILMLIKTLTDNAIRYTPQGSQIDLACVQTDQWLIFSVEDNGNGIAKAERERVLEPFYRILGTEQQGTGLGLAIADTIVKRYGGYLELQDSTQFSQGLLVRAVLNQAYLRA